MNAMRIWAVPAVLAVVQLVLWPVAPWLAGEPFARVPVAVGVLASLLVAVALGWRRRAPVGALAAVVTVLAVGSAGLPEDALTAMWIGNLVALYSVAVRCTRRTVAVAALVVGGLDALLSAFSDGTGTLYLADLTLIVVLYPLVAVLGTRRRDWHLERRAAAARMAGAAADEAAAVAAERQRLARELHDVSAHHLTAILVRAMAAQRVTQQPELVPAALEFASRTSRTTIVALRRLVTVMADDEASPAFDVRLVDLVDGHRALGQTVCVSASGVVPAVLGDAVHAVVRESLTNAVRHAPGAPVTVDITAGCAQVDVVVRTAPGTTQPPTVIGSGRGLTGLRDRMAALGGTLTAGPGREDRTAPDPTHPDPTNSDPAHAVAASVGSIGVEPASADLTAAGAGATWVVRAVLPTGGVRRSRRPTAQRVLDLVLTSAAVILPVCWVLGFAADGEPGARALHEPATVTLVALVLAVGAGLLPLRRRMPWLVLGGVVCAQALWPAAVALRLLPSTGFVLMLGLPAVWAGVYTVGERGRPRWATFLAVPASALVVGGADVAMLALDGSLDGRPVTALAFTVAFVGLAVVVGLSTVVAWVLGLVVGLRRGRTLARERAALGFAAVRAAEAARGERARIAAGVRIRVLDQAARVVAAADAGRLGGTIDEARATLASMRELLETLSGGSAAVPGRAPQPTASAINDLCAAHQDATLTVSGAGELPTDVDVSVFRIVQAALGAGDQGPVRVELRHGDDDLSIRITGVPHATTGRVAMGLRARTALLGGHLRLSPTEGTVEATLALSSPALQRPSLAPTPTQRRPDRAPRLPDPATRGQLDPAASLHESDPAQHWPDPAQRWPDPAQRWPDPAQRRPEPAQRRPDGTSHLPGGPDKEVASSLSG